MVTILLENFWVRMRKIQNATYNISKKILSSSSLIVKLGFWKKKNSKSNSEYTISFQWGFESLWNVFIDCVIFKIWYNKIFLPLISAEKPGFKILPISTSFDQNGNPKFKLKQIKSDCKKSEWKVTLQTYFHNFSQHSWKSAKKFLLMCSTLWKLLWFLIFSRMIVRAVSYAGCGFNGAYNKL